MNIITTLGLGSELLSLAMLSLEKGSHLRYGV